MSKALRGVVLGLALAVFGCGDDDPGPAMTGDGGTAGADGGLGTAGSIAGSGGVSGMASAGTSGAAAGNGGGGAVDAGTPPPVASGKPKADGTQGASCDPNAGGGCADPLACYTAGGATDVGYCTSTCTSDDDCTALGAAYSCSDATGGSSTRYCRAVCTGADDTSCPQYMACLPAPGGVFRCLYDEKDIGTGASGAWGECTGHGDCTGELVCYPNQPQGQGGGVYGGACSSTCMADEDCKDVPATGNVTPTCGGGGVCILDCAPQGGGGVMVDAAVPACPDGMHCANLGQGRQRCMYMDATGGV